MTDEEIDRLNGESRYAVDAAPAEWLVHSDELRNAAELLWAQSSDVRVLSISDVLEENGTIHQIMSDTGAFPKTYVLLAGLSLENALKGLLVATQQAVVLDGRLPRLLDTHALTILAARVPDLELQSDEHLLLDLLEEALPYWARYPVPKHWRQLSKEELREFPISFRSTFLAMQRRLCQRLYDHVRGGWSPRGGIRSDYFDIEYEPTTDTKP